MSHLSAQYSPSATHGPDDVAFARLPALSSPRAQIDGRFFAQCGRRLRVQGVTYGPFAPNEAGEPFPTRRQVEADFERMTSAGVNAVRTYYVPPAWFLEAADEHDVQVLIDVPWPKHLCFLESESTRRDARRLVREAAERGQAHGCILGYSIGNEIPANIVRWHGARRVERFLEELSDVARQADPRALVTYANYPSTEYLELPFLDFATFNVYLHDLEAFRRYLIRLQNQIGDKPLLLGELGMDSFRHTEEGQAAFVAEQLREAVLMGLAGAFVFSWTDDWYTGGHQIEEWAFGITRSDRSPKPALYALGDVYRKSPAQLLADECAPPASVVVCSYNGASTLDQCLRSLLDLDYPEFEIILVDDGSTDNTAAIAARYPEVQYVRQDNLGLSVARNTGYSFATGEIIAYTDSDCYVDRHWLTHLVYQLQRSGAAAVGGPNLTPDDGRLASCVAAAPGQPTHVLENDQTAEHIPGCNMAFRREALEAVNGFAPKYRKAGDDVDICWRLQHAGMWITFAPGAFVWHHRRQNPRAYLRQQAGYGEAEGLLWFDHPDRFNARGEGKWHGVLYGAGLSGLRLGAAVIYRGIFASGLFQTLYRPGPAHWASFPVTLEWQLIALSVAVTALLWPAAWVGVALMLGLALAVAGSQAAQARLPAAHRGLRSRLVVAALCYAQPLTRSWWRYRTHLFPPDIPLPAGDRPSGGEARRLPLTGAMQTAFWDEKWRERIELLNEVQARFGERPWAVKLDSGWSDWDMEVYCHAWTSFQVCTAQEDHGAGRRLIRVRYRMRPTEHLRAVQLAVVSAAALTLLLRSGWCAAALALLLTFVLGAWQRGRSLAAGAAQAIDEAAQDMGMVRCDLTKQRRDERPASAA